MIDQSPIKSKSVQLMIDQGPIRPRFWTIISVILGPSWALVNHIWALVGINQLLVLHLGFIRS